MSSDDFHATPSRANSSLDPHIWSIEELLQKGREVDNAELHETWEYKFVDLDFSSSENALSFGGEVRRVGSEWLGSSFIVPETPDMDHRFTKEEDSQGILGHHEVEQGCVEQGSS